MEEADFDIIDGESTIVLLMLYNVKLSQEMPSILLEEGIYVIGFLPRCPKRRGKNTGTIIRRSR